MDLYTELLHECNACICSGILSEQKKFCRRLMIVDMQCLTKSQYEYLLMKVENCISDYYNNLSNANFYSALNNNERIDRTVIDRTMLYLKNINNDRNKGMLLLLATQNPKNAKMRNNSELA